MKLQKIGLIFLLSFGTIVTANAHDSFGFSINLGVPPVYYATPHSYYYEPRVYAEPPRAIYYGQPITSYSYYDTRPYYEYSRPRYRDEHRHWHQHRHDYDEDD